MTENVANPTPKKRRWPRWLGAGLLLLAAAVLVFARGVDRGLNHDEHQFIAPGAILARQGAQPYRDYPLFHLPNLVFVYAAVDRLTGDLILGTKFVSIFASCASLGLLVLVALRRPARGLWLAAGALALVIFDPLFFYTTGQTWNHELPTALALGALLLLDRAGGRDSLACSALAGLCAGLAVGCRLTFAPMLLPMGLAAFFFAVNRKRQLIHVVIFTATATLALAPSIYYLVTAREAFLFGNLEFPRLRLLDPTDTRAQKTITFSRKLRYFVKEIVVPSWPLFLAFLATAAVPGWRWFRRREPAGLTRGLVMLVVPFFLLGCFVPSRYQYQHYFVLVPFLALGVILGLQNASRFAWFRAGLVAILALISIVRGIGNYRAITDVVRPETWFSTSARSTGDEIRRLVPRGKVLTLAPVFPLAGGVAIYPEFATGPFAWRGAHLVPAERRARLHLIAPDDLETFLAADPPAAILTGFESGTDLETPFLEYAQRHDYRPVNLTKKRTLWRPQKTAP